MFLQAIGVPADDKEALARLRKATGLSSARLRDFDSKGIQPSDAEFEALAKALGVDTLVLRLQTGFIDRQLRHAIAANAEQVARLLAWEPQNSSGEPRSAKPDFESKFGALYHGDCLEIMRGLPDSSCDVIFADPPFNLDKLYPSEIDDDLRQDHYLEWCEKWLLESIRLLKDGGSLFVYNLPKWNTFLAAFLNRHLTFRHWIVVDIKFSLPVSGRLYPSHYSLLYYCKGDKPKTFHPDRLPMDICPSCMADLKDYGGYKDKMNPRGVNIADVWNDIPPVRHAKYKKRKSANELSVKLLDRVIEMASDEGDTVLDPFGGSGTTYAVAEIKKRRWIGMELGPVDEIIDRLKDLSEEERYLGRLRDKYNVLFTHENAAKRTALGLWTTETFAKLRAEETPELPFED